MTALALIAALLVPPACPIEAPALAKLRAEHAAMNAGGLACLKALDATRAERDQCHVAAEAALDDLARELAESAEALDAAGAALAVPVPQAEPGRPWALVGLGGLAGVAGATVAAGLESGTVEVAGAGLGAAAVAVAVAAVVAWATE